MLGVIVSYNTRATLDECLKNLVEIKNSAPAKFLEIVVYDNASNDGSAEMVETKYPSVKIMKGSENLGISAAANAAAFAFTSDYILYLGSDAFPSLETVAGLSEYLDAHPKVALATTALIKNDGSLDLDAHRGIPTPFAALSYFLGFSRLFPSSKVFNRYFMGWEDLAKPHEIEACISHFMFVRRKALFEVGGWDEDYFVFGEDIDLCYRLRSAGYKIMYLPQYKTLHLKGVSVGIRPETSEKVSVPAKVKRRMVRQTTKAMRMFYKKNMSKDYPFFMLLPIYFATFALEVWRITSLELKLIKSSIYKRL